MKTKTATFALLLMAFTALGQQERGTFINGIEWAPRNVGVSGEFAPGTRPDKCGHYYQWNRAIGYDLGDYIPWSGTITDYEFKANPCPPDWRLPTWGEMSSLRDVYTRGTWAPAGSIKGNLVPGRFMGPNHANATIDNPGAAIFMPACGIFWGGTTLQDPDHGYYYYHAIAEGSKGGSWWFSSTTNGGAGFEKYCAMQLRCIRAEWLTIDGIEWAKSNLTTPGTFASRPDMQTQFYQWGKNDPQPITGTISNWDATPSTATAWTDDPCPTGWRLPTFAEFQTLTDKGYTWASTYDGRGNAVDGVFLGENNETCTLPYDMVGCVFLPANGLRNRTGGTLGYGGLSAFYWSSEQATAANARGLRVDEIGGPSTSNSHKAFGYNIRCVHDVSLTSGDESSASSASNSSMLNITQASYNQALNYSRVIARYSQTPIDTLISPTTPDMHTEVPNAKLYPNPVTNGQLTIDNGELEIGMVEVRDRHGVLVHTQDFGSQTVGTLQLRSLQGVYFIRIGETTQSIQVTN